MNQKKEGTGDSYHLETKYSRQAMPRGGLDWAHQPPPYKEYPKALRRISIQPADERGGKPFWETIAQRRSVREFAQYPVTFSELSQLIWATQGITLRTRGFDFRSTPSAGALYPVETYIVANRVDEISPGIYHYNVKELELVLLREGDFGKDLQHAGLGQEMLEQAACVFVWTAIIARSKWKYRERAYRYIYMDVGHIGQNLYSAATSLGLGCCTAGAFFDEEVDLLIGTDGKEEISLYLGAVGRIR